jgi:hypothetical protein
MQSAIRPTGAASLLGKGRCQTRRGAMNRAHTKKGKDKVRPLWPHANQRAGDMQGAYGMDMRSV